MFKDDYAKACLKSRCQMRHRDCRRTGTADGARCDMVPIERRSNRQDIAKHIMQPLTDNIVRRGALEVIRHNRRYRLRHEYVSDDYGEPAKSWSSFELMAI